MEIMTPAEIKASTQALAALSRIERFCVDYLKERRGHTHSQAMEYYTEIDMVPQTPQEYAHEYAEDYLELDGVALKYFNVEFYALDRFRVREWEEYEGHLIINALEF